MSRIGGFLIVGALALPLLPAARLHLISGTPTATGSIGGTVVSEGATPLAGAVMSHQTVRREEVTPVSAPRSRSLPSALAL